MMFPSLRQEGYITAPHQHCRRVSRPWGSLLAPFFDSPESIGMEGIHLQLPLRCPLGSQCLMSLPKSWSQSQVGLSTRWGPGTQGLCFKTLAHWELLTSRDLKWQPTPVFLPGESQGQQSLVGCHLWGRTESDTTEATSQQQQQQRFCFNLKGRHTVHPSPLRLAPIPIYPLHPQSQTHTPTKAPPRGQTRFGNEAPPEAQGVNSCTEGCVLWSQHLRRWEGRWAEKEGVSGPDGSEEGKWGEVVRTRETRKPRMTR